ncbi:MAG: prolyl oligopeptidase family serine peptidase [Chromatocurvus sp.]
MKNTTRLWRVLINSAVSILLVSQAALAQEKAPLVLEDVFQLGYADAPLVSAGGDFVVYTRHTMDIMQDRERTNLWIVRLDGSEHRPLTSGAMSVSHTALSPDDTRVAFVAKDDAGSQIFVHWLQQGYTAQLTKLATAPGQLSWSPDGQQLAFTMRVARKAPVMGVLPAAPEGAEWAPPPVVIDRAVYRNDGRGYRKHGFQHVFVMPASGGSPRQVTSDDFDHSGGIAWSASGDALFVSANRGDDAELNPVNTDLFRVDLATGALTRLTDRPGPDSGPVVSPDGRFLAYTGWDDAGLGYHRQRLYIMHTDGTGKRELQADLDRDVSSPQWSEGSEHLFFSFDDRGNTVLAMTDLEDRMVRLADGLGGTSLGRPYAGSAFAVGGGDVFAYTAGDTSRPADIAAGRPGHDAPTRLTTLNENFLGHRDLARVEERWITSSADGEEIQAWVALPPGFDPNKKYPLILEIHGGPFANYGERFATEVQLYAAAGYVVLYVNPRGSTSYGERFGNLIHHAYPGRDYDDLISAVDAVIDEGYIDTDGLFVTGGSGGGVLTAWIVGKTDRFRAAVVAKPVINWTSFVLTADNSPYFTRYWFEAMPWEDPEGYWARSPLSLVGNVRTPTMLLTGESDLRTPISETEQYYQALKLRGVDTAMVRIPGAYHSITKRPSQMAAKVAAILAWFEQHTAAE